MLKIILDIDDTLGDFINSYNEFYKTNILKESQKVIAKKVLNLRKNKNFWLSLKKMDTIDFDPICYCTKRINPKTFTRNWLSQNDFPIKPIYQVYTQSRNKADLIKGVGDVLIDDSWFNVQQCINSGFPALLIDRPHNVHINTPLRIKTLTYKEIESAYETNGFRKIKRRD